MKNEKLWITYTTFGGQAKTTLQNSEHPFYNISLKIHTQKLFNYEILDLIKYNICHTSIKFNQLEDGMGFLTMNKEFSFSDVVLESSKKHNRSIKNMEKLNKSIDRNRVEDILINHYTLGWSGKGAHAYPPLLLFKCLMLQ